MSINYQDSKIYTIRCLDDPELIYVGSTVQPLSKRFATHKSWSKYYNRGVNRTLYKIINEDYASNWDRWYIELHENYPCNNRNELNQREGEIIREIGSLNKNIAGRTKKEYNKMWNMNHPDYQKTWCMDHPDYHKKWNMNHPDYHKNYYIKRKNQVFKTEVSE